MKWNIGKLENWKRKLGKLKWKKEMKWNIGNMKWNMENGKWNWGMKN